MYIQVCTLKLKHSNTISHTTTSTKFTRDFVIRLHLPFYFFSRSIFRNLFFLFSKFQLIKKKNVCTISVFYISFIISHNNEMFNLCRAALANILLHWNITVTLSKASCSTLGTWLIAIRPLLLSAMSKEFSHSITHETICVYVRNMLKNQL